MIDDQRIRQRILEYLPNLEPWRLEMEELDFGERIGVALKVRDNITVKFSARAHDPGKESGTRFERREGSIASELVQRIKAAFLEQEDREAFEAEARAKAQAQDERRQNTRAS